MGNCIVLKKEDIKISKIDGEVLEYKAPMKVHQLSKSGDHAVSDTVPFVKNLQSDRNLTGVLFSLLELHAPTVKKTVELSNPVVTAGQVTGIVRIKLVISKQELQALLLKEGAKVDHTVPENDSFGADSMNHARWKPALACIPEEN